MWVSSNNGEEQGNRIARMGRITPNTTGLPR